MAKRYHSNKRPPNSYTQYGRRRIRQEQLQHYANSTPKQQENAKLAVALIVFGLFVLICLFLYLIGGTDAIKWWLTPKGLR